MTNKALKILIAFIVLAALAVAGFFTWSLWGSQQGSNATSSGTVISGGPEE